MSAKSRSKKTRRPLPSVKLLDSLNELAGCHYRLSALAGLLASCGETMEAGQVSAAGLLVAEQANRLEELLSVIGRETRP